MCLTDYGLARVRNGEILHLQQPRSLQPLIRTISGRIERALGSDSWLPDHFAEISEVQFAAALATAVEEFDSTRQHYRMLADSLIQHGVSDKEGLLDITLDKSVRVCLTGRKKKNYGYFAHRDSWFDLAPDGVNIVLYLTDVPCHGNTQFYPELFRVDIPHDPESRRVLDDARLTRVTSFHCRAGDVLIFSGDHLHSGAPVEVDRFSVEFRLSRKWQYGRPDQGIVYRPLTEYSAP